MRSVYKLPDVDIPVPKALVYGDIKVPTVLPNIIILEGADAVGKTTVAYGLYHLLQQFIPDVTLIHSTRPNSSTMQSHEMLRELVLAMDRPGTTIFDRFHISALVYSINRLESGDNTFVTVELMDTVNRIFNTHAGIIRVYMTRAFKGIQEELLQRGEIHPELFDEVTTFEDYIDHNWKRLNLKVGLNETIECILNG